MAAETGHELVALDMSDPSHPRDASFVRFLLCRWAYSMLIGKDPRIKLRGSSWRARCRRQRGEPLEKLFERLVGRE
jgi:hypothetical protein